jgi:hypothetical protein
MEPKHTIRAIIVTAAGTKYIGDVVYDKNLYDMQIDDSSFKEVVLHSMSCNAVVSIKSAIIIDEMKVPIPNPNNPQQVAINRMINVMPLVHILDVDNSLVYVKAVEIAFLEDMSASDRAEHEKLFNQGQRMLLEQRAQRAKITLPTEPHIAGGRH